MAANYVILHRGVHTRDWVVGFSSTAVIAVARATAMTASGCEVIGPFKFTSMSKLPSLLQDIANAAANYDVTADATDWQVGQEEAYGPIECYDLTEGDDDE